MFNAFHKEFEKVEKYSKLYYIGKLKPSDYQTTGSISVNQKVEIEKLKKQLEIRDDFDELRRMAFKMNLFSPSYLFFFLHGLQIILFHISGYYILWKYGCGMVPIVCALICHVIAQVQADWTQHDYGHSSFMKKPKLNRYMQMFFVGFIKGISADWWNHMHNQHHAKPNVVRLDFILDIKLVINC